MPGKPKLYRQRVARRRQGAALCQGQIRGGIITLEAALSLESPVIGDTVHHDSYILGLSLWYYPRKTHPGHERVDSHRTTKKCSHAQEGIKLFWCVWNRKQKRWVRSQSAKGGEFAQAFVSCQLHMEFREFTHRLIISSNRHSLGKNNSSTLISATLGSMLWKLN